MELEKLIIHEKTHSFVWSKYFSQELKTADVMLFETGKKMDFEKLLANMF